MIFMKHAGLLLILFGLFGLALRPVSAQSDAPRAVVLTVDGAIVPAMQDYIERGLESAEQRGADLIILQLNTPGGDLLTTIDIIGLIRASRVPVVVYVAPRNAIAGSAGALITMAGHASAMAPESAIGASSPISSTGEDLDSDSRAKAVEITKATIRPLVTRRGEDALQLAESMIDEAKAVTAEEALEAGLIDFIAVDLEDLFEKLDGFTVQLGDGPRVLETSGLRSEPVDLSLIEQLLLMLTDANIAFLLIAIGVQAILIELSSPGGWVAGFIGVVCLALAMYGAGVLPVNWFGIVFIITSFVLFVLDIKAPTHGALTAAGVGTFIVGALVLFNSPGTPEFQRVSPSLVIGVGVALGLTFAVILTIALRSQHVPVQTGVESVIGKLGVAKTAFEGGGQVQVGSELWSADSAEGSEAIRKGDQIEVVKVEGLRLKVKKKI
jgi:membrane-bound serine protease (ClpP class)